MTRLNIIGFETGDGREFFATVGSPTYPAGAVRSGQYGMLCDGSTTCYGQVAGFNASAQQALYNAATVYIRTYLKRYDADTNFHFIRVLNTGSALKFLLTVDFGARTVSCYDSATGLLGTSAAVLSTTNWNRIEVKVATGASAAYEVKVDGLSVLSGAANLSVVNNGSFYIGVVSGNDATAACYVDDVSVDNSEYPGVGQITRLDPDGNGYYTAWMGTYADVDDYNSQAGDDGDSSYISSSTVDATESEALEPASGVVSGTIKGAKSVLVLKRPGGSGSSSHLWIGDSSGSAWYTSSDASPTSTNVYELRAWMMGVTYLNLANLDDHQVGLVQRTAGQSTYCTAMATMVEYEPNNVVGPFPTHIQVAE